MSYSPTAPAVVVVEVATAAAVDEPALVVDAAGSVAVEVATEGIPEVSARQCAIRCSTSRSIQLTHAWCVGRALRRRRSLPHKTTAEVRPRLIQQIFKTYKKIFFTNLNMLPLAGFRHEQYSISKAMHVPRLYH